MSTSIGAETTTCRSCNADMPASALLCPNCGRPNVSTSFFDTAPSAEAQGTQAPGQIAHTLGTDRVTTPPATPWPGESAAEVLPSIEIPRTRLPWETQPEAAPEAAPHSPTPEEPAPAGQDGWATPTATPPQQVPRTVGTMRPTQAPQNARPGAAQQPQQSQFRWPQQHQVYSRPGTGPDRQPPAVYEAVSPYAEDPQEGQAAPDYDSDDAEYNAYVQNPSVRPLSPTLGFLLELLGYVGLLGFGHMYGKHTERGRVLLMGWWLLIIAAVSTSQLAGHLSGLVWLLPFGPWLSGWWAMRDIERLELRRREAQK